MKKGITLLRNNTSESAIQRNGMDFCKSQRPLQPMETLKTSSPPYQRPIHIPVQMVYPAIQKTSDDNRKKPDIRSDPDIKDHDMEDLNMTNLQEDSPTGRRQRGFVPERMKDSNYWVKRIKNNLAAKRSREKRRMADVVMESKVSKLAQENEHLRSELANIKRLVQNNLLKDNKQEVALGGGDVLLPSQGTQTQFAVGAAPQSIPPLIIPTYPNPLTTFPAPPPPQGVFISPQTGLPQSTLPQPGLSQSGFPQAGLLQPSFLQDVLPQSRLPHPSLPQAVQPVRQQRHNLHGVQDSLKVVQGSSNATLANGSCPQLIFPAKNTNSASRSEFSDPSRLQVPPTLVEKDKSRLPSDPLQNSAVESTDTSAKAPNGVIKVRAREMGSVVDVEIYEDQEVSERTAPVVESPMLESKSVSAEDDRKSVSASPSSSDTYDTPSPAEINKLPHKLRARFLRSLCRQEEAKTTASEVHTTSNQPPMEDDPILINIKKEKEDDASHDEVGNVDSECPPDRSSYQWILPKSEFPMHPLRSIEEELDQARNLLPTPSRTMTRSESQAYAELAKAAADLVGARLQSQDFSAPSMRQLTRQRTRDMNQEEKYRDKRVRNNIAAKKCRDAKRLLIEYRSARSNFFEVENMTLRDEVESLTKDVLRLRELVRRKQHN